VSLAVPKCLYFHCSNFNQSCLYRPQLSIESPTSIIDRVNNLFSDFFHLFSVIMFAKLNNLQIPIHPWSMSLNIFKDMISKISLAMVARR